MPSLYYGTIQYMYIMCIYVCFCICPGSDLVVMLLLEQYFTMSYVQQVNLRLFHIIHVITNLMNL